MKAVPNLLSESKTSKHPKTQQKFLCLSRCNLLSENKIRSQSQPTTTMKRRCKVCSNSAMSYDSPPPIDEVPELTPDNGTTTSSESLADSFNSPKSAHQVEEYVDNSQSRENVLHIFHNGNQRASDSDANNTVEHRHLLDRVPPSGGFQHPRSPYPWRPVAPSVHLDGLTEPLQSIPSIDIGSPVIPLPLESHPEPAIEFVNVPTVVHTPASSSSERSPTPYPGSSSRRGHRLSRLRDFALNIGAWVRGTLQARRNEQQPWRRLARGWTARWRNGNS